MLIIEDSRQKAGKHESKHRYWSDTGIEVVRSQLPFGDYMAAPKVSVDTKQDIQEVALNMCGAAKEKQRFREECKLAQKHGCKLIFLIEDGRYRIPDDLLGERIRLHNGQTVPGDQIYTAMKMHEQRYGCEFWFCDPAESGKVIQELLEDD